MPELLSLNVGRLEGGTGIHKRAVAGAALIGYEGVEGDQIGDSRHHGGPDQAVYLYSAEDYAWWEMRLGRELDFGAFGDNLTVSDLGGQPPRVGDIWHLGEVSLQMTAPRIPCATLATAMKDRGFVKAFARANRGGAYARVLKPGKVGVGASIGIERASLENPTIDELFALWHQRDKDPELMRRALLSPLAERTRRQLERWRKG